MKHAFLILAHNNFEVIKALLHQLDDEDFEIYIHINAKTSWFPQKEFEISVGKAELHFVERVAVGYCDYSMVEGVKSLLKSASDSRHDYYHLISGADLMIKSREEFKHFFDEHKGKEFVAFSKSYEEDRIKYRNYFVAKCRQESRSKSMFYIKLRKFLISIQKALCMKNHIPYEVKKGADWYSLSHDAVLHLLREEPEFKKYFYYSYCPTEFFAQTLLWNSAKFRGRLYGVNSFDETIECAREIDWKRGSPYVYRLSDYGELMKSPAMFARKFDESTDIQIVKKLMTINEKEV